MIRSFFVLKTSAYSEADLFITGLDSLGAKIRLVARGALKSRKRFGGGVLEPTHLIEGGLSQTERDGVRTLNEAKIIESFPQLRKSYQRIECALRVLDWVERMSLEGVQDNRTLFDLLGHTLRQISVQDHVDRVQTHFLVRLFLQQGLLPEDPRFRSFIETPMARHSEIRLEDAQWLDAESRLNQISIS